MGLNKLLAKRKSTIVNQWFDMAVKTYPIDTSAFIKRQKDPFSNPVGSNTLCSLNGLFDELLGEMDYEQITSHLDHVIRIRAVQDLSPSQAVGFILLLKKIIRTSLEKELQDHKIVNDLFNFESKIDEVSLIAFEIYIKCREKIYDLKANAEKNRFYKVRARAGLIAEEL